MPNPLPSLLEQAHEAVARVLGPGDFAVDCTVGNGRDTLHLARIVGREGRVLGLDIDAMALDAARRLLHAEGLDERVELVLGDHAELSRHLDSVVGGMRPRAVMFNLGYRPGGDRRVRTHAGSTLEALRQAYEHLDPPALLSIVAYLGHPGAAEEYEAVRSWSRELDAGYEGPRSLRPRVLESRFLHADHATSSLIMVGIESRISRP